MEAVEPKTVIYGGGTGDGEGYGDGRGNGGETRIVLENYVPGAIRHITEPVKVWYE